VDVKTFRGTDPSITVTDVTRAETTIEAPDGQQFRVFMLDAEDTLDLVVHYPDGQREIVWSLVKDTGSLYTDE
jgi:hypothetical protein